MPTLGGLSHGLAALPQWLNAGTPLERLFGDWAVGSGYRTAGLVWPAIESPKLIRLADLAGQVTGVGPPPAEWHQVLASLTGGPATTVWAVAQSSGRLYTLLTPPGEPAGLLFAERPPGPWSEVDRHYLTLSSQLIARSDALAVHTGARVGSERLAERLADAALIAGRVAHDFAGVFTGVCGYGELATQLLPRDSRAGELLANITRVGQRGTALTQRVREFSTCGDAKPSPGSVPAVALREAARLGIATAHWPPFASALPPVAMEPGPLGLVLGHLLANAAEALPATRPAELAARLVELTPTEARQYRGAAQPGACVEVTVRDFGPGVRPEVVSKLFAEPFVTTKPRHPGLGLAVAFRALAAHHGGVRLDSADPGTAARFVVPLARVGLPRPPVTSLRSTYHAKG